MPVSDNRFFADSDAEKAKAHAQKVSARSDWSDVQSALAEEILRAKFTQNPDLAQKRQETCSSVLIFGATHKNLFWGKDLYSDCGENQLGKLLMKIRDTSNE